MKKILILCPYPEGKAAGQRLKYEQYFDDWTQEGYEITVSSFFSKETFVFFGSLTSVCEPACHPVGTSARRALLRTDFGPFRSICARRAPKKNLLSFFDFCRTFGSKKSILTSFLSFSECGASIRANKTFQKKLVAPQCFEKLCFS